MSAPWDGSGGGGGGGSSSAMWIASPALKGTIVLAQCRSWLLAEEESRCRALLNQINSDKHALKTSLHSQSESMQAESNEIKAKLAALNSREEKLRRELDESSTVYLRLYRDPLVSRGDDRMLREKQRSNELWGDLEAIIHQRNECNMRLHKIEHSNMIIIQHLYQTQILLQTQLEKDRQRGGELAAHGGDDRHTTGMARSSSMALMSGGSSGAAGGDGSGSGGAGGGGGAGADDDPTSPKPVSLVDARVADEVSRLSNLRNSEINLQKKLSKFLGLREQVQSYLLKIAGFQKKLAAQQQSQSQQSSKHRQLLKDSSSAPGSGRASPSSSTPSSPGLHGILKQSGGGGAVSHSRAQSGSSGSPIGQRSPHAFPAQQQQSHRKDSNSGVHSVYRPTLTPEPDSSGEHGHGHGQYPARPGTPDSDGSDDPPSPVQTTRRAQMAIPHTLLVRNSASSASAAARSDSPSAAAAASSPPGASSHPHRGGSGNSIGSILVSSRASASTGTSPHHGRSASASHQLLVANSSSSSSPSSSSQSHSASSAVAAASTPALPAAASPSSTTTASAHSERERVEQGQLATLVFDQRNRKVLQRICECFHRSGLPSSRRWKRTTTWIHNAFRGVELLTWLLNAGVSSRRNDALTLLELLLRAGLVDMIQEQENFRGEAEMHAAAAAAEPSPTVAAASAAGEGEGASPSPSPSSSSSPCAGSLRVSPSSAFGDMRLQFALYRLRGDVSSSSDTLSKSGWLHKVTRWRVHRRYFAWDVDAHRLALYNSNKDEHPARVYHLGSSTIIGAVEDAAAVAAQAQAQSRGVGAHVQFSPSPSSGVGAGAGAGVAASDAGTKFYFQVHLHPPQNDESTLLLYAPSARERAEWLKVLWLSGCEYPSLGASSSSAAAGVYAKDAGAGRAGPAGVAPGSRPKPIHPSMLMGASFPLAGGAGAASGAVMALPQGMAGSAADASDSDEEEEDDLYYDDSEAAGGAEAGAGAGEEQQLSSLAAAPTRPPRQRFSADDSGHMHPTGGPGNVTSLVSPSFSALISPTSLGGSGSSSTTRRRVSLAEKKRESDLTGVFALRRAKSRFAQAAAWARLQEVRKHNVDRRRLLQSQLRRQRDRSASSASVGDGAVLGTGGNVSLDDLHSQPLPAADGLELGWRDFFVAGFDSAEEEEEEEEQQQQEEVARAGAAALVSPAGASASAASATSRRSASPSASPRSQSQSGGGGGGGAADAHPGSAASAGSGAVLGDSEDDGVHATGAAAAAADSENDSAYSDSDDELGQHSDYNSEDELEGAGGAEGGDLNVVELLKSAQVPAAVAGGEAQGASEPAAADLEQLRMQIRKQRFQAIALSLTTLLQLPASTAPSTAAAAAAHYGSAPQSQSASSAPLHPLTAFVASFVRQFNDLYGGALELEPAGSPQAPGHRSHSSSLGGATGAQAAAAAAASDAATAAVPAGVAPSRSGGGVVGVEPVPEGEGVDGDDSDAPVPPVLYPFPRHARAVLSAAKDDVRTALHQLNQVVADALAGCEAALRKEAEREARLADGGGAAVSLQGRHAKRAAQRRADPSIRRIEREMALLSRLCSQLLSHRLFQLVYAALFPLYRAVHARKNYALQVQMHQHRHLTFRQMGLADELIFSAAGEPEPDAEGEGAQGQGQKAAGDGTAISYQHAIDAFRSLSALSSPIDKLQCVVSVAKAICACVDQAKQAQAARQQAAAAALSSPSSSSSSSAAPAPVVIGADDLLLLFAYLLIHARSGALLAELAFLADFIPEHQRCTMQGYYLATTQAAAELLASDELKHSIAQREGAAATAPATTTTAKEPPANSDGPVDQVAPSATTTAESAPEQAGPATTASSEDAVAAAAAAAPAVTDTQAPAADATSITSAQQEQTPVHNSPASLLN